MIKPSIYWVTEIEPYRLALMPRPRGGDLLRDEITVLREVGIHLVVSLLEAHEVRELELQDESKICEEYGIEFSSFPIVDRGVPSSIKAFLSFITQIQERLTNKNPVAIHCRAGIGRTGLVAACLLHSVNISYKEIFPMLSRARGVSVPDTTDQIEWVEKFARFAAPFSGVE